MAVIGVDLGATKLAAALFDDRCAVLERSSALLDGRGGDDVARLVRDHAQALRDRADARGLAVEALGVAVPGIARRAYGTARAPNIAGWEAYPLRDALQAEFGPPCRVVLENDRAASVLGEVARGAAQGCRHAIFLAVGTGIGAGVLVNGAVLRGARDIAGAIGWMALDRPYRAVYDRCGGFESNASGAGIARIARELLAASPDRQGPLSALAAAAGADRITAREVFEAFAAGDDLAARVVDNALECWGMAVANLASLFDPEMIVLGGGLFGPAAGLLDRIVAEARRWAQPVGFANVEVRVSELGADACLVGMGDLALRESREGGIA